MHPLSARGPIAAVERGTLREGTSLGLVVATSTWLWVILVDAIAGRPFHSLTVLGDPGIVTAIHFGLNVLYAVVLVAAVRGSERTPSLIIAVIFGLVMIEVGFAMLAIMLGQAGVGSLS